MITRREMLQAGAALAALFGALPAGGWGRLMAQQSLTEADLLAFEPVGNVTLLHMADLHAQLTPVYYREPMVNLGGGGKTDKVPHVTGADFLKAFDIAPKSRAAYALTGLDFDALAAAYGKMGGLDRVARILDGVRAARPGATLLLDSGDSWQGSYTSLKTKGQDVIDVMAALEPDAMTGHWEFTYGAERVSAAIENLSFPFLAGNVIDATWEEPVFKAYEMFERGGVKVAVIGQAFPYTPIANPRHFIPDWSFGIRGELVQRHVDEARKAGAGLVVLLSHNGFDLDRKLAGQLEGVDVILTGHTHDALPEVQVVNRTLLVASGSNGKFLSRLDLDVQGGEVKNFGYRLIPIFSDVIMPKEEVSQLIEKVRKPYLKELNRVVGRTDSLLYRRGTFNGTWDDLICAALRAEMDTEIALSPGFRWGTSLPSGSDIRMEDVYTQTAITYPAVYKREMTGAEIKTVLEDVADNLLNEDPFYAQGGDMVRVGGLGFTIAPAAKSGQRISDLRLLADGSPLSAARAYSVSGWASTAPDVKGPPVWEVVSRYISALEGPVDLPENNAIKWPQG